MPIVCWWMSGAWNDLIKLVNRWRLEKVDPTCVSDCAVVEPITYYIDPSVRPCILAAVAHIWSEMFC